MRKGGFLYVLLQILLLLTFVCLLPARLHTGLPVCLPPRMPLFAVQTISACVLPASLQPLLGVWVLLLIRSV